MPCIKVGYVRTSKKDQNPELQRRDLLAAGCDKLFEEQVSSRKEDRPELKAAMDYCRGATRRWSGSSTGSADPCAN